MLFVVQGILSGEVFHVVIDRAQSVFKEPFGSTGHVIMACLDFEFSVS